MAYRLPLPRSRHTLVVLILHTAVLEVVAPDSIAAMTVRSVLWIIILALLCAAAKKRESC